MSRVAVDQEVFGLIVKSTGIGRSTISPGGSSRVCKLSNFSGQQYCFLKGCGLTA